MNGLVHTETVNLLDIMEGADSADMASVPISKGRNREAHRGNEKKRKEKTRTLIAQIADMLPGYASVKNKSMNMTLERAVMYMIELKEKNDQMLLNDPNLYREEELRNVKENMQQLTAERDKYLRLLEAAGIPPDSNPSALWKGAKKGSQYEKLQNFSMQNSTGIVKEDNHQPEGEDQKKKFWPRKNLVSSVLKSKKSEDSNEHLNKAAQLVPPEAPVGSDGTMMVPLLNANGQVITQLTINTGPQQGGTGQSPSQNVLFMSPNGSAVLQPHAAGLRGAVQQPVTMGSSGVGNQSVAGSQSVSPTSSSAVTPNSNSTSVTQSLNLNAPIMSTNVDNGNTHPVTSTNQNGMLNIMPNQNMGLPILPGGPPGTALINQNGQLIFVGDQGLPLMQGNIGLGSQMPQSSSSNFQAPSEVHNQGQEDGTSMASSSSAPTTLTNHQPGITSLPSSVTQSLAARQQPVAPSVQSSTGPQQVNSLQPGGLLTVNNQSGAPSQHPTALMLPNGQIIPVVTQPSMLLQGATPVPGGFIIPANQARNLNMPPQQQTTGLPGSQAPPVGLPASGLLMTTQATMPTVAMTTVSSSITAQTALPSSQTVDMNMAAGLPSQTVHLFGPGAKMGGAVSGSGSRPSSRSSQQGKNCPNGASQLHNTQSGAPVMTAENNSHNRMTVPLSQYATDSSNFPVTGVKTQTLGLPPGTGIVPTSDAQNFSSGTITQVTSTSTVTQAPVITSGTAGQPGTITLQPGAATMVPIFTSQGTILITLPPGSQPGLIVDGNGVPLFNTVSASNQAPATPTSQAQGLKKPGQRIIKPKPPSGESDSSLSSTSGSKKKKKSKSKSQKSSLWDAPLFRDVSQAGEEDGNKSKDTSSSEAADKNKQESTTDILAKAAESIFSSEGSPGGFYNADDDDRLEIDTSVTEANEESDSQIKSPLSKGSASHSPVKSPFAKGERGRSPVRSPLSKGQSFPMKSPSSEKEVEKGRTRNKSNSHKNKQNDSKEGTKKDVKRLNEGHQIDITVNPEHFPGYFTEQRLTNDQRSCFDTNEVAFSNSVGQGTKSPPNPKSQNKRKKSGDSTAKKAESQEHISVVNSPPNTSKSQKRRQSIRSPERSKQNKKSTEKPKSKQAEKVQEVFPETIEFSETELSDVLDQVESLGKPVDEEPEKKSRSRKSKCDADEEPHPKKRRKGPSKGLLSMKGKSATDSVLQNKSMDIFEFTDDSPSPPALVITNENTETKVQLPKSPDKISPGKGTLPRYNVFSNELKQRKRTVSQDQLDDKQDDREQPTDEHNSSFESGENLFETLFNAATAAGQNTAVTAQNHNESDNLNLLSDMALSQNYTASQSRISNKSSVQKNLQENGMGQMEKTKGETECPSTNAAGYNYYSVITSSSQQSVIGNDVREKQGAQDVMKGNGLESGEELRSPQRSNETSFSASQLSYSAESLFTPSSNPSSARQVIQSQEQGPQPQVIQQRDTFSQPQTQQKQNAERFVQRSPQQSASFPSQGGLPAVSSDPGSQRSGAPSTVHYMPQRSQEKMMSPPPPRPDGRTRTASGFYSAENFVQPSSNSVPRGGPLSQNNPSENRALPLSQPSPLSQGPMFSPEKNQERGGGRSRENSRERRQPDTNTNVGSAPVSSSQDSFDFHNTSTFGLTSVPPASAEYLRAGGIPAPPAPSGIGTSFTFTLTSTSSAPPTSSTAAFGQMPHHQFPFYPLHPSLSQYGAPLPGMPNPPPLNLSRDENSRQKERGPSRTMPDIQQQNPGLPSHPSGAIPGQGQSQQPEFSPQGHLLRTPSGVGQNPQQRQHELAQNRGQDNNNMQPIPVSHSREPMNPPQHLSQGETNANSFQRSSYSNPSDKNSHSRTPGLTSPPLHHNDTLSDSSRMAMPQNPNYGQNYGRSSSNDFQNVSSLSSHYEPPPLHYAPGPPQSTNQNAPNIQKSSNQSERPKKSSIAPKASRHISSASERPSKSMPKKGMTRQQQQQYEVDTNLSNSIFESNRSMTPYFSISNLPPSPPRNDGPTYIPSNIFPGPPPPSSRSMTDQSAYHKNPDINATFNSLFNPSRPGQNSLGLNFQPPSFGVNSVHGSHASTASINPHTNSISVMTPHVPNFNLTNIFGEMPNPGQPDTLNISPIKFPTNNPILPPPQGGMDPNSLHHHQQAGTLYHNRPHPPPAVLHNMSINNILGHHNHHGFEARPMAPPGMNNPVGPPFHGHGHTPTFGMPPLNFTMHDH
ncbi:uncharacterized protein LOC106160034 [Lingula anatina]|uniref:Uncharacterized protein LOC106160034 n=1 Tax=Lingula anatina TaxID=7574 RepID=A0A1S3I2C4_LINAN|nr:uncharacterized protein LOC106160034 [Lingula anatina]XP_023930740.1 uncharacterized protein LOC106160034 [Lingula anatina]|eukprot:XP_013391981.1 uncharacterized protein LOC106160034 [Lingula anatina]